jgi:hypothetical protein
MSVLSAGLGIPISISFSNLPGRRKAGSSESGRLVAAKTKTAEVDDYKTRNIENKYYFKSDMYKFKSFLKRSNVFD